LNPFAVNSAAEEGSGSVHRT